MQLIGNHVEPQSHHKKLSNESEMSKNVEECLACIDDLSINRLDLDGNEMDLPTQECIYNAKRLITDLISKIYSNKLEWIAPYISREDEDNILIEWYTAYYQLHLEINDSGVEYTAFTIGRPGKSNSEIREGRFKNENYISEWKLLINGK